MITKKYNLELIEDRKAFIEECERNLITDLRELGLILSPKAIADIEPNRVEIGTNYAPKFKMDLASNVNFRRQDERTWFLSAGSSGSFNPLKKEGDYWRLFHAGQVLLHWDKVVLVLEKWSTAVTGLLGIPVSDKQQNQ